MSCWDRGQTTQPLSSVPHVLRPAPNQRLLVPRLRREFDRAHLARGWAAAGRSTDNREGPPPPPASATEFSALGTRAGWSLRPAWAGTAGAAARALRRTGLGCTRRLSS